MKKKTKKSHAVPRPKRLAIAVAADCDERTVAAVLDDPSIADTSRARARAAAALRADGLLPSQSSPPPAAA
jgi:hypothetical protein